MPATNSGVAFTQSMYQRPAGHLFLGPLDNILNLAHSHLGIVKSLQLEGVDAGEKLKNICFWLHQQRMPCLEHLSLTVIYLPNFKPPPEWIPHLPLRCENFPALYNLKLDGLILEWQSNILPRLRVLKLHNYPASGPLLSMSRFISWLYTATSLQTLQLYLFLNIAAPDSAIRVAPHPHLEELSCADDPDSIRALLCHLDIPPTVRAHLSVPCPDRWRTTVKSKEDGWPLSNIFPEDDLSPSILAHVTSVDLIATPTSIRANRVVKLVATAHYHGHARRGQLTLEVHAPTLNDRRRLVNAAICATIQHILFWRQGGTSLNRLTVQADLAGVTCETWKVLLVTAQQLEHLDVTDTRRADDALAVCEALGYVCYPDGAMEVAAFREAAVRLGRAAQFVPHAPGGWQLNAAPQLRTFALRGSGHSAELAQCMFRTLVTRKADGVALEGVTLELSTHGTDMLADGQRHIDAFGLYTRMFAGALRDPAAGGIVVRFYRWDHRPNAPREVEDLGSESEGE